MERIIRVLAIGDPHFRISNVRDAQAFRQKVVSLVKKLKPDKVIILGDLHNDFERIHSLVMAEICALFREVRDALRNRVEGAFPDPDDSDLYYVVGNHDAINNQIFLGDEHAFLPFKEWNGVQIVDRPTSFGVGSTFFYLLPYVPPGRLGEALATIEPQGNWLAARAIFCHQEFKGVQLGPITSKHGDEWHTAWPLVVSGHIHEHQVLNGNILYVGTPFDQNYGEDSQKTVSLLDFMDDGSLDHKRIDLGLPKRLTLTMTIDEIKAYQKPENTHVRVYVTGTAEELHAFKKTKEYKNMSQVLKIIPKSTDPLVVRRNEGGRGYHDILNDFVAEESEAVQEAYREVSANAPGP